MHPTSSTTATGLRFTVLRGGVAVEAEGQPLALGGPAQRRLLAALLSDPDRTTSADWLVEAMWPADAAPDGARRTVMSYVSRLRSTIGADRLITDDHGYRLVLEDATFDAADFELALAEARASDEDVALDAYDRALSLWAGRAFGDDAEEWWLQPVATRLEELRLVAHEERAELLIALGQGAQAVADLEALIAEQPLRERFVELTMRALHAGGRQAEAMRAYQRFRRYLAEETGLEPSDLLVDLERRIAAGDLPVERADTAVPGYELGEVIGEGASATVYRAVQPGVGREVAVKVVRSDLADDPAFIRRFEAEAQLVARLEHPHIVPLYDFWRRPGGAFLVFRLLRGGTLADRLAQGPIARADVGRLVAAVGDALIAAHGLGVVHGDVKPGNVLFDEAGHAYLADFAIGVDTTADEGTPAGDQAALALVAREALADGDRPDPVEQVLRRATSPHPSDRYPSMAAFTAAWRDAITVAQPDEPDDHRQATTGDPGKATTGDLPDAATNPFKGLGAFREADAADYCGREALVAEVVAAVEARPFVTVVGPSGSGKSSLVHAGAVPALRRAGDLIASMHPGNDPWAALDLALSRVATTDDAAALRHRLRQPGGLAAVAADLAGDDGRLVVVVDQFEELWTTVDSTSDRARFVELLAASTDADVPLRIVATLRADRYDRPLQEPRLGAIVSDSTVAITPMSPAELTRAVEEPARRMGVRFEPGLVTTIANDVGDHQGALPLLQFTLTELFERRTDATISVAAYQQLGGLGGALARRAEQLYLDLDEPGRGDARRLFLQLVTGGEDRDDLRRRATPEDLAGIDPAVVVRFSEGRLLVTDHHPTTREPTVEVAHEALLREWPRLRTWIDDERATLRQRRHLRRAAQDWQEQARDPSALLRGTRLDAASDLAGTQPLTALERDLITASRALAAAEREETEERVARQAAQNRRLRRLVAAVGVVLVVAVVAALVAVDQRSQARDAATVAERSEADSTVRRLASDAQTLVGTNPDLALLLAAEAARRSPDARTADALATTLLTDPDLVRFEGNTTEPRVQTDFIETGDWPGFSPDGSLLAVPHSADGIVEIVEVTSGELVREIPLPVTADGEVAASAVWPTDDTIVLIGQQSVTAIDATSGQVTMAPSAPGGDILRTEVSPDGSRVATLTTRATPEGPETVEVAVQPVDGGETARGPVACCRQSLPYGDGNVEADLPGDVAWVGDDLYVASGSGVIERWDPDTATAIEPVPIEGPDALSRISASPEGDRLYVSGAEPSPGDGSGSTSALQAYDTTTGQPIWTQAVEVAGLALDDPRHDAVRVTRPWDGQDILTLDRDTGEEVGRTFSLPTGTPCGAYLSPDARYLAAGTCTEAAVGLWSLDGENALLRRLADGHPEGNVSLHPDGVHAFVNQPDGGFELNLETGERGASPYPGAAYTSSGRLHLLRGDGIGGVTPEPATAPSQADDVAWATEPIPSYPLSYDLHGETDRSVFQWQDGTLRVSDGPDEVATIDESVQGFGLSRDASQVFVAGSDGTVRIYDVDDPAYPAETDIAAEALSMSPDRRTLIVTGADGTISLIDADTLETQGDPIGGVGPFAPAAMTPDEATLLAFDHDTIGLRLYDVATRSRLGVDLALDGWGVPPAITADGRRVYLLRGGSVVELTLDRDAWFDAACRAAGRNLTAEEWQQYVGGEPTATCPQWPAPS